MKINVTHFFSYLNCISLELSLQCLNKVYFNKEQSNYLILFCLSPFSTVPGTALHCTANVTVIDGTGCVEALCAADLNLFNTWIRLLEETSCQCICEEAVGEPEELPVLGSVADACCVGTTWQPAPLSAERMCCRVFSVSGSQWRTKTLAGSRVEHHHTVPRPFKGSNAAAYHQPHQEMIVEMQNRWNCYFLRGGDRAYLNDMSLKSWNRAICAINSMLKNVIWFFFFQSK